jgi:hypothetical protein
MNRVGMFGSKRRREPREGRGATHYQMRQRMISIGDAYVIENDRGECEGRAHHQEWDLGPLQGPGLCQRPGSEGQVTSHG